MSKAINYCSRKKRICSIKLKLEIQSKILITEIIKVYGEVDGNCDYRRSINILYCSYIKPVEYFT